MTIILCSQSLTRHRGPILPLDLNQQGQGVQVAQAVVEADWEVDGEAGAGAGAAVVEVEEVVVVEDSWQWVICEEAEVSYSAPPFYTNQISWQTCFKP